MPTHASTATPFAWFRKSKRTPYQTSKPTLQSWLLLFSEVLFPFPQQEIHKRPKQKKNRTERNNLTAGVFTTRISPSIRQQAVPKTVQKKPFLITETGLHTNRHRLTPSISKTKISSVILPFSAKKIRQRNSLSQRQTGRYFRPNPNHYNRQENHLERTHTPTNHPTKVFHL